MNAGHHALGFSPANGRYYSVVDYKKAANKWPHLKHFFDSEAGFSAQIESKFKDAECQEAKSHLNELRLGRVCWDAKGKT